LLEAQLLRQLASKGSDVSSEATLALLGSDTWIEATDIRLTITCKQQTLPTGHQCTADPSLAGHTVPDLKYTTSNRKEPKTVCKCNAKHNPYHDVHMHQMHTGAVLLSGTLPNRVYAVTCENICKPLPGIRLTHNCGCPQCKTIASPGHISVVWKHSTLGALSYTPMTRQTRSRHA
jgi:hypothetical protein